MAIRTVNELLKTQQELLDRMRKQTEAAAKGGKAALNVVRQAKERELAYLKERFEETEEARAATASRYEAEMKAQQEAIERLQKDLGDLEKFEAEKPPVRPPVRPPGAAKGGGSTARKK